MSEQGILFTEQHYLSAESVLQTKTSVLCMKVGNSEHTIQAMEVAVTRCLNRAELALHCMCEPALNAESHI